MAGVGAVSHSIISGVFAASAGVAGKLAFDKTLITKGCVNFYSILQSSEALSWLEISQFLPSFLPHTDVCDNQVVWLLQLLVFIFLIVFNVLMFSHFNHALQLSSTTLQVSIINTASNFLTTALFGSILFNEVLNKTWWIGTALVIIGTVIIGSENSK